MGRASVEKNVEIGAVVFGGCWILWECSVTADAPALGCVTSASPDFTVNISSCGNSLEAQCRSVWEGHGMERLEKTLV